MVQDVSLRLPARNQRRTISGPSSSQLTASLRPRRADGKEWTTVAPLPRRPPRGAEPTLRPPLAVLAASTGDWARREHLVPPRAAARAMPDLEPEPEPDPQQLLLHRELATMTLGALTRRAIESEVPAAEIGQAIDADDPKATLRDLVLGRATPERLLLPGSSAQRETTIKPRAGETRNEAIMRTMDESVPGPSTATLRSVEGSVHEYDGACKFNKLTTAVDRCVYKQPWDRLLCTYLWRIHSDLPDDLHAKLRMPCGRATTPKPGCKIVEYDFDLDMPGAIRFAAGVSSYKWIERVEIDLIARRCWSFSPSVMWTDKFAALEFIEFHAVNDEETYCRKGLIADTGKFPPQWAMNLIGKSYVARSKETIVELNKIADDNEQLPGANHPDSVAVREFLGIDTVSAKTPPAAVWIA